MTLPPDDEGAPLQASRENHSGGPASLRKLGFLGNPASYPDATTTVRVVETHFAWVFLTDRHAWKMKKPIRAQVIDYRRLEDRERYCREELRLNRRLAEWVYLDVVPLTEDNTGALRLGGDGHVRDWLVKMLRLPEDGMLDRRIDAGPIEDAALARIARHLREFYAGLEPEPLEPDTYVERLLAQVDEHERHFRRIDAEIAAEPWRALLDAQRRYIHSARHAIGARAEAGRIVECHGDLRPEHICLGQRFAIIDCLEFSRDLRIQDCAEEVAFLALECERAGGDDLRDRLLAAWHAASGDRPGHSLLRFYLSRRAIVRAILSAWHLEDPDFDRGHYAAEAHHYLGRARAFIDEAASDAGT